MRGRKETLGTVKEGTRSKSRTGGVTTAKSSVKGSGKTAGRMEASHGVGHGIKKSTTGKGVTHK